MMRDGLVNDQIKRQVLESLKPVLIEAPIYEDHGDLKKSVLLSILYNLNLIDL